MIHFPSKVLKVSKREKFSAESRASLRVEAVYDASFVARMVRSGFKKGISLTSWLDKTMSTTEDGSTGPEMSSMLKNLPWTTTGRKVADKGNIHRKVASKATSLVSLPQVDDVPASKVVRKLILDSYLASGWPHHKFHTPRNGIDRTN